ncbi:HdeD family acid-resistance protein [Agromyces bauzanensis]|uniref:HdeD family acid-resistance protein n=1 Tax=Agromyces bauzanensis TaxID=1308924 RepID=UPI0031F0A5BF
MGAVAIVLGVLLITRPLSSLAVLAVYIALSLIVSRASDALDARDSATPVAGVALGLAWALLGVAVVAWLGRSIDLLAPVIAVALIGGGIRLVRAVRGTADELVTTARLAVADIVSGVLALWWPDATLIVIAVLFGARTVFFGVREVARHRARARSRPRRSSGCHARAPRRARAVRAHHGLTVIALALAVVAALAGSQLRAGAPILDAFCAGHRRRAGGTGPADQRRAVQARHPRRRRGLAHPVLDDRPRGRARALASDPWASPTTCRTWRGRGPTEREQCAPRDLRHVLPPSS